MYSAAAFAFLMTVVIEVAVAWLFGFRRRDLLAVLLVNIITNIPLNTIILASVDLSTNPKYLPTYAINSRNVTIVFEIFVILIEWDLLRWATKKSRRWTLLVSVIMNAASFSIGLVLLRFF